MFGVGAGRSHTLGQGRGADIFEFVWVGRQLGVNLGQIVGVALGLVLVDEFLNVDQLFHKPWVFHDLVNLGFELGWDMLLLVCVWLRRLFALGLGQFRDLRGQFRRIVVFVEVYAVLIHVFVIHVSHRLRQHLFHFS